MTEQEQKAFDQMRQVLIDIKYGLEGARIWGGMDWTYNPLHPFKYLPLRDKAEQALTAANAVSAKSRSRKQNFNLTPTQLQMIGAGEMDDPRDQRPQASEPAAPEAP